MSRERSLSPRILSFAFFLSGAASLADEVVWFKYLNLIFGATTAATSTLLAVFLGGLALGSAAGAYAALLLIRVLLSAAVLLVPTVLMGATFPALARCVEAGQMPGRRSAMLYGVNTAGAVAGIVLCGFFAIPGIGLRATLLASACASLAAALLAMTARVSPTAAPEPVSFRPRGSGSPSRSPPAQQRWPTRSAGPASSSCAWALPSTLSL